MLSVQHEVHRLADRHVRRPPGLALQAEPRREGRQQEGHTPPLVLQPQGERAHQRKHFPWHWSHDSDHDDLLPSVRVRVLQDWIEFEEIADLEERAKSQFFEKENEEEVQKNQAAAKEKEFQSVKATKDQVGEVRLTNQVEDTVGRPIRCPQSQ